MARGRGKSRSRRKGSGGRRKGGGKTAGRRTRIGGLLILLLGGAGIWIGASLADDGGWEFFPSLERDAGEEAVSEPAVPAYGARVRVEVLNAGGVRGMAARARNDLRDQGFDVVFYGNARSFGEERSVVLHRGGERDSAEAVARTLGIEEVRSEPDSTLLVDVTVLLGASWRGIGEGEGEVHDEE